MKTRTPVVIGACAAVLALAAGAFALFSAAPPVTVTASLQRARAAVGDSIRYTVSVSVNAGWQADVSSLETVAAGFIVRDSRRVVRRARTAGGREKYVYSYVLAQDAPGDYELPPVTVRYRKSGAAEWQEARSRGYTIVIASVVGRDLEKEARSAITIGGDLVARGPRGSRSGDNGIGSSRVMEVEQGSAFQVKDAPGPRHIPTAQDIVFASLLGIGGLVILIFGASLLWEKFLKRPPPPPVPPAEAALRRLKALKPAEVYAQGASKAAYGELDALTREYLRKRFGLREAALTAREFIDELAGVAGLTPEQKSALEGLIRSCDLVKYSEYSSNAKELEEHIAQAKRLVKETAA